MLISMTIIKQVVLTPEVNGFHGKAADAGTHKHIGTDRLSPEAYEAIRVVGQLAVLFLKV